MKRFALLTLLLALGCHDATAPKAQLHGPGCTLYFLPDTTKSGITDVMAQHFDVCPRLVWDEVPTGAR